MADKPARPSWDQRYDSSEYLFGTTPNDFLESVAPELTPGKVLCLADGEGRNGVYLAGLGHNVTSIDASAVGLEKARRLAEQQGVTINTIHADLNSHDLGSGAWNTIVSIFFHMPPAFRIKMHARIETALKPGGRLILEAYTPDQLKFKTGGPPNAELLMTSRSLQQDFTGLEIISVKEKEREVVEGTGHSGMASVVQLLARKPL